MSKIVIKGNEINILHSHQDDYICLTDIVKHIPYNYAIIGNWLRLKDTIEYLGLWERLHNPGFKLIDFDEFRQSSGSNRFALSPQQWIAKTGAIGIESKSGRGGGTFAHRDIAFHFAMWISPEFHLLIVKEYQRLKEEEQKLLNPEWDYRRFLSKVNYHLHTDAIKDNIIPAFVNMTKEQERYVYADEAEILNMAVFGISSKQWRETHGDAVLQGLNIRDFGTIAQLTVLANLQSYNAILITEGKPPKIRFEKLRESASVQLKSLSQHKYKYPVESPNTIKMNLQKPRTSFDKDLI